MIRMSEIRSTLGSNKRDLQWKALSKECRNETGSDVAQKVSSRVRVRTRLVLQQNGALLAQKSGGREW